MSRAKTHNNKMEVPGIRVRVIARLQRSYEAWVVLRHIRRVATQIMNFFKQEGYDRSRRYVEAAVCLVESKARKNDAEAELLGAQAEHQRTQTDLLKDAAALWALQLAQNGGGNLGPVMVAADVLERLDAALKRLYEKGGKLWCDRRQLARLSKIQILEGEADAAAAEAHGAHHDIDAVPPSPTDRRQHDRYIFTDPVLLSRDNTRVVRRAYGGNISASGIYALLPLNHRSPADGWRAGQMASVHFDQASQQSQSTSEATPMNDRTGKVIRTRVVPDRDKLEDYLGVAIQFDAQV